MLDFSLTPRQEEIRNKARDFALQEVLPVAWRYDAKDELPLFILRRAFEAGLMNTDIPESYGGKGWGMLESALMTEEIAAACPGLATSVFDNSLGLEPLLLSKNESLRKRYLPRIAKEFTLICFATSEPMMGSDVAGIRCKAERRGEDYILDGTKYWITNGGVADYITVFATVDPESRHKGVCAFLVEKDWEGVRSGLPIPKMGQRCSNTVGLHFDGVRVPAANVLAEPGDGFVLAMKTFARTRSIIGAFATGAARSAMEYAVDYVKKRRAFGRKIADYQSIQFKLAEMYQKVDTMRLLTWKAAVEADRGEDPTVAASIAKFYASEAAMEVVEEALQIFGGYGYTKMFPIEKLLRDMRLLKIYEGTSEIQRQILSGFVLDHYQPVMPPLEDLPLQREKDPEDIEKLQQNGRHVWRCRICGYVHVAEEPPEQCPYCFYPQTAFKQC